MHVPYASTNQGLLLGTMSRIVQGKMFLKIILEKSLCFKKEATKKTFFWQCYTSISTQLILGTSEISKKNVPGHKICTGKITSIQLSRFLVFNDLLSEQFCLIFIFIVQKLKIFLQITNYQNSTISLDKLCKYEKWSWVYFSRVFFLL